jgi:hypothetical protein
VVVVDAKVYRCALRRMGLRRMGLRRMERSLAEHLACIH